LSSNVKYEEQRTTLVGRIILKVIIPEYDYVAEVATVQSHFIELTPAPCAVSTD